METNRMWQWLRRSLIIPHAKSEDARRREYIFNILITGTIVLALMAFVSAVISQFTRSASYQVIPLFVLLGVTAFFILLLVLSKCGFYRYAAYIFILTFFAITTYPIMRWGVLLPQGILTYCVIIVIAGVLLDSRAGFRMSVLITATLLLITHLQLVHAIHFDLTWMHQAAGGYNDVVIYGVTFMLVALVSWLSNRQIEQSLIRARQSEKALRHERNSLELKVRERTKALERAQVEQLQELNHFAEFGRISSTLLHELANPITAAMLNLDQLEDKQKSTMVKQIRESVTHMEQYVDNARRQLRNQSEIKPFDIAEEIKRVIGFIDPKAKANQIRIEHKLVPGMTLVGDSVKFDQVVSNLLANAIDAIIDLPLKQRKPIKITMQRNGTMAEISIQDFGMGIPQKELTHVFDAFYTTKSVERGTGLGLTITKRAIEEDFNGTIKATSSKAQGTCFELRIPLQ